MQQPREVPVWDPFVRGFHWTVVAAFAAAFVTGDEVLTLHVWAGYLILALLAARIVWGFVGPHHARFADFVTGPRQALVNLKDTFAFRAPRYLGHTPAGGAMILALMLGLALTGVTGLMVYGGEQQAGPLAGWMAGAGHEVAEGLEEAHEVFAWATLVLAGLHLLGVLAGSLGHRENLVRSMITGRKRAP